MVREQEKLTVSIDRELVKWVDEKIAMRQFSDRGQAIEYALKALKVSENVHPLDRER
ncbi:MAG: ribbon-helix-helix protein, CopG family [Methanotrichaceae archaeon]|nr:ribbon-helix-helix protein, CopG family [Methanotrichaceae archaeon]